jgi:hypothetical protein
MYAQRLGNHHVIEGNNMLNQSNMEKLMEMNMVSDMVHSMMMLIKANALMHFLMSLNHFLYLKIS